MADQMDPVVRSILFGDQAPAAPLAGDTDRSMHPVEAMVFEQQYKLPAPGTAAPARKALTIDEVEKQLAERRKARRVSFAEANAEFLTGARATIKAFCADNRDAIGAAGSFEKLFE